MNCWQANWCKLQRIKAELAVTIQYFKIIYEMLKCTAGDAKYNG